MKHVDPDIAIAFDDVVAQLTEDLVVLGAARNQVIAKRACRIRVVGGIQFSLGIEVQQEDRTWQDRRRVDQRVADIRGEAQIDREVRAFQPPGSAHRP